MINIIVEGNGGCGKSTFLTYFKGYPDIQCVSEPVEEWKNYYGHNFLDLYYGDPKRWSFAFQFVVQKSFLELALRPSEKPIRIFERSIFSSLNAFVPFMKEKGIPLDIFLDHTFEKLFYTYLYNYVDLISGYINDIEVQIIDDLQYLNISNFCLHYDMLIYIRTDANICYERMMKRGNPEESKVPLDIIKSLNRHYDVWLLEQKKIMDKIPILVLDGNVGEEEMRKVAQKLYKDIKSSNFSISTIMSH